MEEADSQIFTDLDKDSQIFTDLDKDLLVRQAINPKDKEITSMKKRTKAQLKNLGALIEKDREEKRNQLEEELERLQAK